MIEIEMTSLEIAEETGKLHRNVRRDIKNKILPKLDALKNEHIDFIVKTDTYKDDKNRTQELYRLNKGAVNLLMAGYSTELAGKLIIRISELESKVYEQQQQLDVMKSIVWEVINGQAFVGQEQALKMAGVKHPRLFMKYLKGSGAFYESVTSERGYLESRQCNSHGDRWWKFSKDGFKWLLTNKEKINSWVENMKSIEKQRKIVIC